MAASGPSSEASPAWMFWAAPGLLLAAAIGIAAVLSTLEHQQRRRLQVTMTRMRDIATAIEGFAGRSYPCIQGTPPPWLAQRLPAEAWHDGWGTQILVFAAPE